MTEDTPTRPSIDRAPLLAILRDLLDHSLGITEATLDIAAPGYITIATDHFPRDRDILHALGLTPGDNVTHIHIDEHGAHITHLNIDAPATTETIPFTTE